MITVKNSSTSSEIPPSQLYSESQRDKTIDNLEQAGHFEAIVNQTNVYVKAIATARASIGGRAIKVLDYGSGTFGLGRALLGPSLSEAHGDELALYDPHAEIQPPLSPNTKCVSKEAVVGINRDYFHIINISYVLCLLEPEEAQSILSELRQNHPSSTFIIIDYILKGKGKVAVLKLLGSQEERKWQKIVGEDEFVRTRGRFDLPSFKQIPSSAGFNSVDTNYLDNTHIRGVTIARE